MEDPMPAPAPSRLGPFPDLSIADFLYGHEGPWPQPSRDHPFGLAPAIYKIPQEEWDAWQKYVGEYYLTNAAGFGVRSGVIAAKESADTGLGYPPITDAEFNE